jgi:hypothetical protein
MSNEPHIGERLDVRSLNAVGVRLYRQRFGEPKLLTGERLAQYVRDITATLPPAKFSQAFLADEWREIVDAWQLDDWESYRDVKRLGRKTRLSEQLREKLWEIFSAVNATGFHCE